MKKKLMYGLMIAFAAVSFAGCSKSDDESKPNTGINAAIGTYKGKISIIGGPEKFDQLLVVTKVSDNKIKVTAQNADLKLPVKELQVSNNSNMVIASPGTEPNGNFIYTFENKSILFVSNRTAEGELQYSFEGTKQ